MQKKHVPKCAPGDLHLFAAFRHPLGAGSANLLFQRNKVVDTFVEAGHGQPMCVTQGVYASSCSPFGVKLSSPPPRKTELKLENSISTALFRRRSDPLPKCIDWCDDITFVNFLGLSVLIFAFAVVVGFLFALNTKKLRRYCDSSLT